MNINITIRGYESERELVNMIRKKLDWIVREELPEEIAEQVGYENLGEDEETIYSVIRAHIYPNEEGRGKFYRF